MRQDITILFLVSPNAVFREIYLPRNRYTLINKAGLAPICQPQGREGHTVQGRERGGHPHGPGISALARAGGRRGGKGLCTAVPGLRRQGREAVVSAFPRVRKPCRAVRFARPPQALAPLARGRRDGVSPPNREACSAAARERGFLTPDGPQPAGCPLAPVRPDPRSVSPTSHVPSHPYLTSFGSRPVSLRMFSSTFLRLSLAFSSCSCKVLTATAIFSLQQASRLLYRPRSAAPRPPPDAEGLTARPSQSPQALVFGLNHPGIGRGRSPQLRDSGPMRSRHGGQLLPLAACGWLRSASCAERGGIMSVW